MAIIRSQPPKRLIQALDDAALEGVVGGAGGYTDADSPAPEDGSYGSAGSWTRPRTGGGGGSDGGDGGGSYGGGDGGGGDGGGDGGGSSGGSSG